MLIAAALGPLPLEDALTGLARQTDLAAPVKFTLSARGEPQLVAEIARTGDHARCERQAYAALDAALQWLGREIDGNRRAEAECWPLPSDLRETVAALGWTGEDTSSGCVRIAVSGDGIAGRVLAKPLGDGGVQLALPLAAIRVADAQGARALALFALEANARLRLARLSVTAAVDGIVRAMWDIVLTAEVPLAHWLESAVEALTVAKAETDRALRALGGTSVAKAYLNARDPRAATQWEGNEAV
jgi:hypothetical protein